MPNQIYDLMLIVSAEADADRRAAILAEAEALIAKGGGSVTERTAWGERSLAFEIDHESVGIYTLLRFEGPGEMLAPTSRQLNITDGLLRHRIIKATAGAPETVGQSAVASAGAERPAATAPLTPMPAPAQAQPEAEAPAAAEAAEATPEEPAAEQESPETPAD
jgi:small subunit ribosomal protein S6